MIMKTLKHLINSILLTACILATVVSGAILYETYMYNYTGASVVKLTSGFSGGTGFQVTAPSGETYILTNAHICRIANELDAHSNTDEFLGTVKVIEIDKKHDLCIMESIRGLRALDVADTIDLYERVWLLGYPGLRPLTLESGHFAGSVEINLAVKCPQPKKKKKKESIKSEDPDLDKIIGDLLDELMGYFDYCTRRYKAQYINNIAYGGNSGSPVLDKWGNVIGVLFAGSPSQPTSSYTVPLEYIHAFLKDK